MKLKFNACPKCRGDLQVRRDTYGMFVSCLQCGLQRDLDAPLPAVSPADAPVNAPINTEVATPPATRRPRRPAAIFTAAATTPGPGVSEGLLRAA